jgi:predicted DNA-binding protein
MEVRLTPETESRLNELASQSGRPTDDLVEDAMAGYLQEVAMVRRKSQERRSHS